jgi:hypothetical protein
MSGEISYKTHILIGVRANGVMTVIADWPHVPKQANVEKEIDGARDGHATYVLCTRPRSFRRADTERPRAIDHSDRTDAGDQLD